MVVMSEGTLFTTRLDSIHLQDLEFEKKLKTLIQQIRDLYHIPETPLCKLSLIISRNQHSSTPTSNILEKVTQLFAYDSELINYIGNELCSFFPRQDSYSMNNTQSISALRGDSELKARLLLAKKAAAKLDNVRSGINGSKHHGMENAGIGHDTNDNKTKSDAITNTHEADISDAPESNTTTAFDTSYIRSSDIRLSDIQPLDIQSPGIQSSDIRSAPIRRRPTPDMTLESESLQEILLHGDHRLADEIYQHIGRHTTFLSFLELLNMYDTHLIDHVELLQRLVPFLGRNKPLLERLKRNLMHDRMDGNEQSQGNHISLSVATSPLDLSAGNMLNDTDAASDVSTVSSGTITSSYLIATRTTTHSPSYRWIPKSLRNENCPGRDDTCWEVLNDEYVSHPTWASEDNGFLSSNKSKSEEMLHLVEDERYALDIDISIISDVLYIMESYLKQINDLPSSQRSKATLTPEKDGFSTALYTQAIKKVYPRERRKDAVNRLRTNPYELLPGFVKLMKQKQLDLQKQRLDKIRYWKDIVEKHYYRFLDYHWESHKSDTRKSLTIQNLVNEIDALWHEQQRQVALHLYRQHSRHVLRATTPTIPIAPDQSSKPILCPPQLVYIVDDSSVICDVLHLMRISCSHQFQYNAKGTKAIELFLSEYLPYFLGLPAGYGLDEHGHPNSNAGTELDDDLASVKTRSHGHHRRLRTGSQRYPQQLVTLEQRLFIGNTNWYCMTRYFQMIYASLDHMKSIDQQYEKSPKDTKRKVSAPLDLTLESKAISSVTVDLTQGYYIAALDIMKAFIRGDLEQIDLEEGIRYIFGNQAHVAFNIGKTLPCLIRQVHQIMNSQTLDGLYRTFKKYQPCRLVDMHSVLGYRYEVDSILEPDDNRFIMSIDGHARQLTLQILGQSEAIFPKNIRNYIDYVTSYQQRKRKTAGVKRRAQGKVFLNRNLEPEDERAPSRIFLRCNMESKIDPRTYRMYFVEETEDVFVRQVISKKRKFSELELNGTP